MQQIEIDGFSVAKTKFVYIDVKMSGFTRSSIYTVRLKKNGAVLNVNRKSISHLIRLNRTPLAAATVHVSYALPAV
jgi:hypothetical protein